jgi:glycosyltransferase involved in cell wall biosynthesis
MSGSQPPVVRVRGERATVGPESTLALLADVCSDQTRLLVPDSSGEPDPLVSIVIPTLNEEVTITDFVDWCRTGLRKAGAPGEIVIVDSSDDSTCKKALGAGARVLSTPRAGLGAAYISAVPFIRGRYVLLGDADLTYDFRDIDSFLEKFRQGYEFILGSRFKGHIEAGAMPALHRYFGTPATTWILNRLYSTKFSDIHCGMRGITRDALVRMDLQSAGWEYASEMVIKAVQMQLRTTEVPVNFLKDREGRVSHHKRAGWRSPWIAGWTNLRSMLVHGAEFFALRPGLALLCFGLMLTLPLSFGPISIASYTFSMFWMLLGMTLSLAGLQSFYLGCLSQLFHDYAGTAHRRWLRVFRYNRSIAASGLLAASGLACVAPLITEYVSRGLTLSGRIGARSHLAILGLLLLLSGSANFIFTLVLHAAASPNRLRRYR